MCAAESVGVHLHRKKITSLPNLTILISKSGMLGKSSHKVVIRNGSTLVDEQ